MTEPERKVRIGPLDTVGGVVVEMGRVYRQARRGDIDTVDAGRLVYMLTQMVDDGASSAFTIASSWCVTRSRKASASFRNATTQTCHSG